MNNQLILILILDNTLRHLPKRQDLRTRLRQLQEVRIIRQQYTTRLRLPQLKALMSEDGRLALLRNVQHVNVVGVDVDCLVADH